MRLVKITNNKHWVVKDASEVLVNVDRILYFSMDSDEPNDRGEACISMYIHMDNKEKIEIITFTNDPISEFNQLSKLFSNK